MKSLITLFYGTLFGLSLAFASAGPAEAETGTELLAPATGEVPVMLVAQADVDFGDDSGDWANDGECDDPRFAGPGAADILVDADLMKDATDCRTAYEAGTISLAGADTAAAAQVDFGDDSSDWANDGECDDPRFEGAGMAVELLDADIMKDATDCRTLYESGSIRLVDTSATGTETDAADIDFGDDSSQWANDGECDDPRFEGTGMAVELLDVDLMKDATDCRTLYESGSITLKSGGTTDTTAADIDFGDDSSIWSNDGECDDPRFTGPGAAATLLDEDMMHDASDCRAAYEAGTVALAGSQTGVAAAFYFGDDTSRWANDGECDDLRFTGAGTDKKLLPEDEARDATDCRTLLETGSVEIRKVYDPAYAAGAPYDSSGIDFGDNTSTYANDGECDDPRFEGPGTAMTLLDSDELHDADDCRTAYEAGTVVLREG